ncbi:glycosyltransferase [Patulibacter sp. NPDC049589]|uniref:glycosyltransferase family 2 protein n=1 Tax=Patulibacter sp. NPDC049589 TaxID=3154731 RepID=UPI0034193DA4
MSGRAAGAASEAGAAGTTGAAGTASAPAAADAGRRDAPRFTVVVPTVDRGVAILPTLRSVASQSERSWELLVVSDGSDDDTDDVVAAFAAGEPRCRLVRTARHGHPGGPRNVGLREARGRYVAYLDHDDVARPEHLATLGGLLDGGASWACVGADRVGPDGTPGRATTALDLVWHPELQLAGPLFEPSRTAHRRALVADVGGWWEDPRGLEDWDLWLRLADAGHHPATSTRRTVVLAEDPGSRRHRMGWSCTQALARLPDADAAKRALDALGSAATATRAREAAAADLGDWYARLLESDDLVSPAEGLPADVPGLVREALADAPAPWGDVRVAPVGAGPALVRVLPCARPAHARRVVTLARRTQRRQLDVLRAAVDGATALPV